MGGMPKWDYVVPVGDLFANFGHNWVSLWPVTGLLFGIMFATYVIRKVIQGIRGEGYDEDFIFDRVWEKIHRKRG